MGNAGKLILGAAIFLLLLLQFVTVILLLDLGQRESFVWHDETIEEVIARHNNEMWPESYHFIRCRFRGAGQQVTCRRSFVALPFLGNGNRLAGVTSDRSADR